MNRSPEACYVGVDCGERTHFFLVLDSRGSVVWKSQVENNRDSIERVLRRCAERAGSDVPVHLVLESLYGFSSLVAEIGRDLGLVIYQVNSKALNHYRDLEGQPHKDDARDAYLLARMAWQGLNGCRLALSPTAEEQVLRRLSRLHSRVCDQRKVAKLRLRSRLTELCPQVVAPSWTGPKYSSDSFVAVLKRWPDLSELRRCRISTIVRVLRQVSSRKEDDLQIQAKALKALGREISKSEENQIIAMELAYLAADIQAASDQLKAIDAKIDERVKDHPVARKLISMPGVGTFTAAAVVGELGPLARTSKEAKVATYAGLTPLNRKSGQGGRNVLAKGVNKHAQQACYLSALGSLRFSSLDKTYYQKQRERHKGHPKPHVVALLALARQRLKLFFKLMTTNQEYDKEILIASHLRRTQMAA